MLWYSIALCAVGAATQGWDQTGSNGANLSFPKEFGIDGPGKDEWIKGLVNAIIFLTAGLMLVFSLPPLFFSLVAWGWEMCWKCACMANFGYLYSGAFIVDPLNHYLGRRGEIFLTACCLTATPIGSAFAQSWQQLFAARFVMGIGIGAKNATVPICK